MSDKFLQMFDGKARELRFFMNLEDMDATLHDNLEKERREARKLLCNAHSCAFPIDNGCRLDPSCVLKVGDEELVSRLPDECEALPHLVLFEGSSLAKKKNFGRLTHSQGVFGSKPKSSARVGRNKLLTRCSAVKQEVGIFST